MSVLIIGAASLLPALWELQHVSKQHGLLLGAAAGIIVFVGLSLWLYLWQLIYAVGFSGGVHPAFALSEITMLVALPSSAAAYVWRRAGLAAAIFAALATSGLVWFVFVWIGIAIWGE
ncbi:hypothetical protein [Rhizobium sp. BK538]|uniref:hypothetical protein n=1 Tax=Rhizobium sp. BK538 TaxID=2586984 RepID=UPI00161B8468|nr:hypothetical protein [Rhizobium sp. BK538]MBB4166441.1 hypothetical protein [Rhizobium sp. BK538]